MEGHSIVVLERGANWPRWIDERTGLVSNVWVIAQQERETCREFEARAIERIADLPLSGPLQLAVMCSSGLADPERASLSFGVLRAFVGLRRRGQAAEGAVILVTPGDERSRRCAEFIVSAMGRATASRAVEHTSAAAA
jgi:hypothetical protein